VSIGACDFCPWRGMAEWVVSGPGAGGRRGGDTTTGHSLTMECGRRWVGIIGVIGLVLVGVSQVGRPDIKCPNVGAVARIGSTRTHMYFRSNFRCLAVVVVVAAVAAIVVVVVGQVAEL
jgi:hypothetical protein